jgi:hypothetical protein
MCLLLSCFKQEYIDMNYHYFGIPVVTFEIQQIFLSSFGFLWQLVHKLQFHLITETCL